MALFAGFKEAAEYLGMTRDEFQLLHRQGKAPQPIAILDAGPIWNMAQIEDFKCFLFHKREQELAFEPVIGQKLVKVDYDQKDEGTYTLFFDNGHKVRFSASGDDATVSTVEVVQS